MRAVWTIWTSLKSILSKGRSKSTQLQCRLVINPETLETQREGEEGENLILLEKWLLWGKPECKNYSLCTGFHQW